MFSSGEVAPTFGRLGCVATALVDRAFETVSTVSVDRATLTGTSESTGAVAVAWVMARSGPETKTVWERVDWSRAELIRAGDCARGAPVTGEPPAGAFSERVVDERGGGARDGFFFEGGVRSGFRLPMERHRWRTEKAGTL